MTRSSLNLLRSTIEDAHLSLAEVNKVQKQVQGILEMEQVGLEQ